MSKAPLLLLDTNVWLDYYLGDRRDHATAFKLLDTMLSHGLTPLFSVACIKDVYYLVQASLKRVARRASEGVLSEEQLIIARDTAWACIDHMREAGVCVGADGSDVAMAIAQRGLHPDFEDDLVIASALRSGSTMLITNDERFRRHCPVAALSSKDALTWLLGQLGFAAKNASTDEMGKSKK